jgi:hypothetical protein
MKIFENQLSLPFAVDEHTCAGEKRCHNRLFPNNIRSIVVSAKIANFQFFSDLPRTRTNSLLHMFFIHSLERAVLEKLRPSSRVFWP